eukprot:15068840-Alexandrium_andersonii.AAC.1
MPSRKPPATGTAGREQGCRGPAGHRHRPCLRSVPLDLSGPLGPSRAVRALAVRPPSAAPSRQGLLQGLSQGRGLRSPSLHRPGHAPLLRPELLLRSARLLVRHRLLLSDGAPQRGRSAAAAALPAGLEQGLSQGQGQGRRLQGQGREVWQGQVRQEH